MLSCVFNSQGSYASFAKIWKIAGFLLPDSRICQSMKIRLNIPVLQNIWCITNSNYCIWAMQWAHLAPPTKLWQLFWKSKNPYIQSFAFPFRSHNFQQWTNYYKQIFCSLHYIQTENLYVTLTKARLWIGLSNQVNKSAV